MSDTRDPETDQPMPTVKSGLPVIQKLIIQEAMEESLALGTRKYGSGLVPFNGRDPLLDLEQELRDALVYARQVRWERDNPPVTDGLRELRDALVVEFAEALCESTPVCVNCLNDIEKSLESGPLGQAVSTIRREAFERGSSPAVGVLLAEIQDHNRASAYRKGLERAVTLLTEAHAAQFHAAYKLGLKDGRAQVVNEKQATGL